MAVKETRQPTPVSGEEMNAYTAFVELHRPQLEQLPQQLWPKLFEKLIHDNFDAGLYFCLEELSHEEAIELGSAYSLCVTANQQVDRHSDVFLVDHAWTTTPERARKELKENPNLLERMYHMMGFKEEEEEETEEENKDTQHEGDEDEEMIHTLMEQTGVTREKARETLINERWDLLSAISHLTMSDEMREADRELQERMAMQVEAQQADKKASTKLDDRIDKVISAMWRYIGTYQVATINASGIQQQQSVWYIMDEVGSAIRHSNTPNCRLFPFLFIRGPGINETIPYTIFYPIQDLKEGDRLTCDMVPADITDTLTREAYLTAFRPPNPTTQQTLVQAYQDVLTNIQPLTEKQLTIPTGPLILPEPSTGKLLVYTDTDYIQKHLSLETIELTSNREQAHFLWLTHEMIDSTKLKPNQYINQLPNEGALVFKNQLSQLIWKTYGQVTWYPMTFDLKTQLTTVVGAFIDQQNKDQKENFWIIKPWNAAHAQHMYLTNTLGQLIRSHDTIPSIAQRYITRPLLSQGRKFDLRYMVLVLSTQPPLRAAIHETFWARIAKHPYTLEQLEYERHFTIVDTPNYQAIQQHGPNFVKDLVKEYPNLNWNIIQQRIDAAIKRVLVAAIVQPAPLGFDVMPTHNKAFGLYGIDVLLTEQLEPIILEVNFAPDGLRASQYEPQFVNHIIAAVSGRPLPDTARNMLRQLH